MAHFISDYSPMDDYQRMLSQADYRIENADNRLPYDNRKKLEESSAHKKIMKAMKILLIIAGLSLSVAIITFGVARNIGNSNILKIILLCSIIMVIGAFGLILIIGCIGGYMETHSEKKDHTARVIENSETWVLTNGCVAVVANKGNGRAYHMVKYLVTDKNNMVDVPFSRMDIIHKVHSIRNKNGKVIADVNATEYYTTKPYVNDYQHPDDDENYSLYFHYYKRSVRRKIEWNENMLEIDKLIKALSGLKNHTHSS